MIYYLLKPLILLALRIYFRRRVVRGKEHEPDKGPFIIVANHPGTLMDPLIIGSVIKARLFFLGKATVFKGPVAWLFSHLGVIPIHRAHDDPSQLHKNKDSFLKCYEHLERRGVLLIFPEGVSFAARKIQKIKSGTARIALEAETRNDFKLGIKILCIGINYSASHRFQSDVFVNIDEPIEVAKYKDRYKESAQKAAHELSDEIRLRLEKLTIALEDEEVDTLVRKMEKMYKAELLKELGVSSKDKEQDFLLTQKIAEAVLYFKEKDPERVADIAKRTDRYFDLLERLDLNHYLLSNFQSKRPLWSRWLLNALYFILGFPLFLFGFLNNYLPFRIPALITRMVAKDVEWFGGMNLAMGIFIVMGFYTGQTILVYKYFSSLSLFIPFAYLLLLPLSGLFAFYYWRKFSNLRGRWLVWSIFSRKTSLLASIVQLREELLNDIRTARKEFDAAHPS